MYDGASGAAQVLFDPPSTMPNETLSKFTITPVDVVLPNR